MKPEDERRAYLAAALKDKGVDLKQASLAIGKNTAYIQQYVDGRSPRYLNEQDRADLVQAFGLDGDRLKPPPKPVRPASARGGASQINAEVGSNLSDELVDQDFLRLWGPLDPDVKIATLMLIKAVAKLGDRKVG